MGFNSHKISRNYTILLWITFITALVLRFLYVHPSIDNIHIARDAQQYISYGQNLYHHKTFSRQPLSTEKPHSDSYRSPGYPLFISLMMIFGSEIIFLPFLIYSQVFLSALLVPLTFYTGIFFLPAAGALIASVFVALSPHLITTTICVLTETLFSFILLSAVCCLHYAIYKNNRGLYIFSGLLFGYSYFINEAVLFFPFLLAIVILGHKVFKGRGFQRDDIISRLLICLIIFALFPVGWSYRNYFNVSTDQEHSSDRAVITMSHGAYPNFVFKDPQLRYAPYSEDPLQPAFGASFDNFMTILWVRVKKAPLLYLKWYLFGKPYCLWNWSVIQGSGDIYINPIKISLFKVSPPAMMIRATMKVLHPIVLVLAFGSIPLYCFRYRSRKTEEIITGIPLLPIMLCVYFTMIYTIFAPWPRYSIPFRPELYLSAVWSFVTLLEIVLSRWRLKDERE